MKMARSLHLYIANGALTIKGKKF